VFQQQSVLCGVCRAVYDVSLLFTAVYTMSCVARNKDCALLCVPDDSREMPAYSDLMRDASRAIAQVQEALNSRLVMCLGF